VKVRGPSDQQRTLVIGRTGSGKSQFAIALLSTRNFDEMPWIIIDYKGEDLIDDIRLATGGLKRGLIKNLAVDDNPPVEPGLYYMNPRPIIDDVAVEAFLWKVHGMKRGGLGKKKFRGNCGLFIDEGYCLPQKGAFDVILTQGRTLYIPVICLYQRPVWMSRFAVAQADYVAVFAQMDERDIKTTASFVKPAKENGRVITVSDELPPYYCLWYDVGRGLSSVLRPAPDRQTIIDTFKQRLQPPHKQKALV